MVEERLAACVNRFECSSVYRREGTVTEDEEVALLAKTTGGSAEALVERRSPAVCGLVCGRDSRVNTPTDTPGVKRTTGGRSAGLADRRPATARDGGHSLTVAREVPRGPPVRRESASPGFTRCRSRCRLSGRRDRAPAWPREPLAREPSQSRRG
ncbi:MAG: divalent cation tolerance protein CutA [Halovenus sp.]